MEPILAELRISYPQRALEKGILVLICKQLCTIFLNVSPFSRTLAAIVVINA